MNSDGLVVQDLSIRYGGHLAVGDLSLSAPLGQVTGLIGPNGAGKSSTYDGISGLVRPSGGTISFEGVDITRKSVPARARMGIGRTFQRMELYLSMTVEENVRLGAEAGRIGANPLRQLMSSRADNRSVAEAAANAIERCGLSHLANVRVDQLSTGNKRLVELARALAGSHKLLLLDEPSSGLDQRETERFGEILATTVDEVGLGILIVEHDMALVMSICAHLFVLDFGRWIFDGTPAQVQASPIVRSAYLGTHEGLDEAEAAAEMAEGA